MTYVKPPAFTRRLVNPLVSRLRAGGVATLTVVGRSSGRPRTVPVIPVEVDGVSYLVSPYGESDWVRNLRRAGTGQLCGKAKTEAFRATELPVAQRPPIIAAYRKGDRSDVGPVLHSAARSRRPSRLPDRAGEQSATARRGRLTRSRRTAHWCSTWMASRRSTSRRIRALSGPTTTQ